MDIKDSNREAFELVVANKLQNSLYHSVFFNEATGRYDCADDAPAAVQFFCCDLNSDWRIWKAAKAQAASEVINIGNELQSWVAVHSFAAKDGSDIVCAVDANALAEEIEKLTGGNA